MKMKLALFAFSAALAGLASAQTNNYFGTSGTLSGSVWSTNVNGPYTSALSTSGGAIINFNNATTTITGGSITVAGINATANATITSIGGTISNFSNGIVTTNVSSGVTLDFASQSMTTSATAGYIKNGDGVWALAGGTYGGGFTLNAGTVIVRGVNAMGSSASNTLALNGGIVASNANRDLSAKYGGGITVGGNVQFGASTGLASATANLTFTNNMALGAATRTLTIGNNGVTSFGGIISGASGTGLTIAAVSGATGNITLGGVNTYTGATTITSGNLTLNATGTIANSSSISIASGATLTTSAKTGGFTVGAAQSIGGGGTVAAGAGGLKISGTLGTTGISTLTVTGAGTTFNTDSVFSWDVSATSASTSSYDKVVSTTVVDNATTAVFTIVNSDYSGAFWKSNQTWADIFTTNGTTAVADWANVFTSTTSTANAVTEGSFSITGNTLSWTAVAVPEPTTALAGLLLGAGLLRRRRVA